MWSRIPHHKTSKSLGQNFILDPKVAARIVSYAGDLRGYSVIEIGPGLGIMTEEILKRGPKKLIAIEKDQRLSVAHSELSTKYSNYECIYQDVLCVDLQQLAVPPKIKIVANLPYNISVILLLKLLRYISNFERLILMFQKEVADRIIAQPGCRKYSTLSVLTQLLCDVKKVEDLPPELFHPSPKVYSSILDITPLDGPRFHVDYLYMTGVLKKVFSGKRKTMRNVLKSSVPNLEKLFSTCNISGSIRAENLSIEQLCAISNFLQFEEIKETL